MMLAEATSAANTHVPSTKYVNVLHRALLSTLHAISNAFAVMQVYTMVLVSTIASEFDSSIDHFNDFD